MGLLELWPVIVDVFCEVGFAGLGKGHEPFVVVLPFPDMDGVFVEVYVGGVEVHTFVPPEAAAVEDGEQCPVPGLEGFLYFLEVVAVGGVSGFKEVLYFLLCEPGEFLFLGFVVEVYAPEVEPACFAEVLEEFPQGLDVLVEVGGAEASLSPVVAPFAQAVVEAFDVALFDLPDLLDVLGFEVMQKFPDVVGQVVACALGVALDLEPFGKALFQVLEGWFMKG